MGRFVILTAVCINNLFVHTAVSITSLTKKEINENGSSSMQGTASSNCSDLFYGLPSVVASV
jgi:hypothetical protein